MFTIRYLLLAVALVASTVAARAQTDGYWLVKEVTGRWEYRVGNDQPRTLAGQYEPIVPAGHVRCLEPEVASCELRYLVNPRSNLTARLEVKPGQSGRWVSLSALKPPPPPVLPATSSELATKFARVTRAGGSRAASACGGDFPLKAPTCGENVDPTTFAIRWPATTSRTISILVERADGQPALFRGQGTGAAGEFAEEGLTSFLRTMQNQSEPVDVTVRVLAEGGLNAVRLVHLPPLDRTEAFEGRVRAVGSGSTSRTVTVMLLALEEGMWSRAAHEAAKLVKRAGASESVLEYALVGLCKSDFTEEKSALRKSIPARRYREICSSDSGSAIEAAGPRPVAPKAAEDLLNASSRSRLGIALLIGNSEYWNTPLNSVKNDVRAMAETLSSIGFAVTTKENLRSPRQFLDALDEVLRRENAAPEDILLVYYSGHGLQLDGKAHLLSTGVSASARVAEDLRDNAQSAEDLLAQMERSIPAARILIVEACRNSILSASSGTSQQARGGFAFQQDDVPNTFVIFANKPGLTAAVRSDYGLMGPFTEAFVYALQSAPGPIEDVYAVAAEKAMEISPGQEPVMYRSKTVDAAVLAVPSLGSQDARAKELLNGAETLYRGRAWDEFRATVQRGKALAADPQVRERLTSEVEFASLILEAEGFEKDRKWAEAAARWQSAHTLFDHREWVSMNAAVDWLLADDLVRAVQALSALAARSDSDLAQQASRTLAELTEAFPPLRAEAERTARETVKVAGGVEFERVP